MLWNIPFFSLILAIYLITFCFLCCFDVDYENYYPKNKKEIPKEKNQKSEFKGMFAVSGIFDLSLSGIKVHTLWHWWLKKLRTCFKCSFLVGKCFTSMISMKGYHVINLEHQCNDMTIFIRNNSAAYWAMVFFRRILYILYFNATIWDFSISVTPRVSIPEICWRELAEHFCDLVAVIIFATTGWWCCR